jgi:transcriptional regulator with XRE-family HTH domain
MEVVIRQDLSGGQIGRIRRALGKTQHELAELLGVRPEVVRKYENGEAHPSARCLRTLALMLAADMRTARQCETNCWEARRCPSSRRENCPTYALNGGRTCWLLIEGACPVDPKPGEQVAQRCDGCVVFHGGLLPCSCGWPNTSWPS